MDSTLEKERWNLYFWFWLFKIPETEFCPECRSSKNYITKLTSPNPIDSKVWFPWHPIDKVQR